MVRLRLFLLLATALLVKTPTAQGQTWSFQRFIEISGSSQELVDFQVLVHVEYDSDMQSDFSDLRFFDLNSSPLPYWIEEASGGSWADIWIRVPLVPTQGTRIFMHYGNAEASGASNPVSTLLHFDDFSSNPLVDVYHVVDCSGADALGSASYDAVNHLIMIREEDNTSLCLDRDLALETGFAARFHYNKRRQFVEGPHVQFTFVQDSSNSITFSFSNSHYNSEYVCKTVDGASECQQSYGSMGADGAYEFDLRATPTNIHMYVNGNLEKTLSTSNQTPLDIVSLSTRFRQVNIDWSSVWIRRYAEPEPVCSTSEEFLIGENPETWLLSGPAQGSHLPVESVVFSWTGLDNITIPEDLLYAWALDGAWSDPTPDTEVVLPSLTEGLHTFRVKAIDTDGNQDSIPAVRSFTVDLQAPETTILSGPPQGGVAASTVTLRWGSTDNLTPDTDLVSAYRLDDGDWTNFNSETQVTFTGLAAGPHSFAVKARDLAGHEDPAPATRDFSVALADLVVNQILHPGEGWSDQGLEVSWTVENIGEADIYTAWTERVFLSSDPVLDAGDQVLDDFTYPDPLASGGQYTHIHPLYLPELAPGDYYLIVACDVDGVIFEGAGEGNNWMASSVLTVHDSIHPNLLTTDVSVSSLSGAAGQPIVLSWTVCNQGTGSTDAPVWFDRVYLSTDEILDGGDVSLGKQQNPSYLRSGECYNQTEVEVALPWEISGVFFLLVKADGDGKVDERGDEGDNVRASEPVQVTYASAPSLDLAVTDFRINSGGDWACETITVSWTVENVGSARAGGQWLLDWIMLSTDPMPGSNDRHVGGYYTGSDLDPGESYTHQATFALPCDLDGEYHLFAWTDVRQEYDDPDLGNNFSFLIPLTIMPRPPADLEVSALDFSPMNLDSGGELSVNWTVVNNGAAGTTVSNWTDGVYLSHDDMLDDGDLLLGTVGHSGALERWGSYDGSATFGIPSGMTGDYFVIVRADIGDRVEEGENEDNATPSLVPLAVQYRPADLLVAYVASLAAPWSGQDLLLSWRVENIGTGRTIPGVWSDRLYASVDAVLDPQTDRLISERWHDGPLAPGIGYEDTVVWAIPEDVFGSHHLFAVADFDGDLVEADEANNTNGTEISIQLTPPPDLDCVNLVADKATSGQAFSIRWEIINGGSGPAAPSWKDRVYLSVDDRLDESDRVLGQVSHELVLPESEAYTADIQALLTDEEHGDYYLVLCCDDDKDVFQNGQTANDTLIMPLVAELTPPPDLQVSHLMSGEVIAGSTCAITWEVSNEGLGRTRSGHWVDRFYASPDSLLDPAGDVLLAGSNHDGDLDPGVSYFGSRSVTWPTALTGGMYLIAQTDAQDEVYEFGGEGNNRSHLWLEVASAPVPDLEPVQLNAASDTPGRLAVEFQVENQGAITPAGVSWRDVLYLSDDAVLDRERDLKLEASVHFGGLAEQGSYSRSGEFSLPLSIRGARTLFLQVDADNAIGESDELDNFRDIPVVLPQADVDLVVQAVVAPDFAVSGQTMSFSWVVGNVGDDLPRAAWRDVAYLSRDQILDETDLLLFTHQSDRALDSGASYEVTATGVRIPLGIEAPYFLIVQTDQGDQVYECDAESNNRRISPRPIAIVMSLPVDLVVTGIETPPDGFSGDDVTVFWTISNLSENTVEGTWTDAVYLSADDAWDYDDPRIGQAMHEAKLLPGEVFTASLTLKSEEFLSQLASILPGLDPGDYHLIVRTDINNNINESAEDNNLQSTGEPFALSIHDLSLGIPVRDAVGDGQRRFYHIQNTLNEDLKLDVVCSDGTDHLTCYLGYERVPDRINFDSSVPVNGALSRILAEVSAVDDVYLMVFGEDVGGAGPFELLVERVPFGIDEFDPSVIGDDGRVTLALSGGGFREGDQVNLVGAVNLAAVDVLNVDSSREYAVFELNALPHGSYDLVLQSALEGLSDTVAGGVTVEVADSFNVDIQRIGPTAYRLGQSAFEEWIITNRGNVDLVLMNVGYQFEQENVDIQVTIDYQDPFNALEPYSPLTTIVSNNGVSLLYFPIANLRVGSQVRVQIRIDGVSLGSHSTILTVENHSTVPLREYAALLEFYRDLVNLHPDGIDALPPEMQDVADDPEEWQDFFFEGLPDYFGLPEGSMDFPPIPVGDQEYCDLFPELPECYGFDDIFECINGIVGSDILDLIHILCDGGPLDEDDLRELAKWARGKLVNNVACGSCASGFAPGCVVCAVNSILGNIDTLTSCLQSAINAASCAGIDLCSLGVDEWHRVFWQEFAGLNLCPGWVGSRDPNEKIGPTYQAEDIVVYSDVWLPYTIYFENTEDATAPAQVVEITDVLVEDLDVYRFQLGEIAFGDIVLSPPSGRSYWHTSVDLPSGYKVEVDAGIHVPSRTVRWTFETLDPATGLPPSDPFAGFLAPNDSTGRGEGHVAFTIMASGDATTGAEITNSASIVFDSNEPIITNEVNNILQRSLPNLVVEGATVIPGDMGLIEGKPAEIQCTVANTGDAASGGFVVELYQGDPEAGGILVAGAQIPTGLGKDDTRDVAFTWTPRWILGETDLVILVDRQGIVDEIVEDDNDRQLTVFVDPRQYTIPLAAGTNLVALPLTPEESLTASGFAHVLGETSLLIRIDESGLFQSHIVEDPLAPEFNIQSGEAYLAVLGAPSECRFSGMTNRGQVNIRTGLNLLSLPLEPAEEMTARRWAGRLESDLLLRYDTTDTEFEAFIPHFHTGPGFQIRGGEGYFVAGNRDTSVVFEGEGWIGERSPDSLPAGNVEDLDQVETRNVFGVAGTVMSNDLGHLSPYAGTNRITAILLPDSTQTEFSVDPSTGHFSGAFLGLDHGLSIQPDDVLRLEIQGGETSPMMTFDFPIGEQALKAGYLLVGKMLLDVPPARTLVETNYPNPFNPVTTIRYQLAEAGRVSLKIYDIRGRLVISLVDGKHQPGYYQAQWHGEDSSGRSAASGVYFYRFEAPGVVVSEKMLLLK